MSRNSGSGSNGSADGQWDGAGGADSDSAFRELMSASMEIALASVALTSAGAALLGMHSGDVFCLWHVTEASAEEPVTSGRLAELTGLTTGAITGVIDRLEAGGFVRRERDPRDRRRQLIRPVPERVGAVYGLFAPLDASFGELEARYDADSRIVIHDYLRRLSAIMRDHVDVLRHSVKEAGAARDAALREAGPAR